MEVANAFWSMAPGNELGRFIPLTATCQFKLRQRKTTARQGKATPAGTLYLLEELSWGMICKSTSLTWM
jgi:hypothetical protein